MKAPGTDRPNRPALIAAIDGVLIEEPDEIDLIVVRWLSERGEPRRPALVPSQPVVCVCGLVVAPEYVQRTGRRRHTPCEET